MYEVNVLGALVCGGISKGNLRANVHLVDTTLQHYAQLEQPPARLFYRCPGHCRFRNIRRM